MFETKSWADYSKLKLKYLCTISRYKLSKLHRSRYDYNLICFYRPLRSFVNGENGQWQYETIIVHINP